MYHENISIEDTFKHIFEQRIDIDLSSIKEKFTYNPKGIIIQDTYNNPLFPIKPMLKFDDNKFNIKELYLRFNEIYNQRRSVFLPWHYCIDFIDDRYYIFNTRPLNMKFPYRNINMIETENIKFNNATKIFLEDNIFDISDGIHICILGDTNSDTYIKSIYELIGKVCLKPFMQYFKLPGIFQRVFLFNIGKRFNIDYLERFSML